MLARSARVGPRVAPRSRMKSAFAAMLLASCSAPPAPSALATPTAPDASALDARPDAPTADASTNGFLTDEVETRDGGNVLVDHVTYFSGSLRIHGVVCRPAGSGAHPLVMLDHGGFVGIAADTESSSACSKFAELGIVAALSSYRGEDGSDGSVEVCAGEVDDVLAMKAILAQEPYVLADRIATIGFSHGACIATMSALRDPSLRAVVDFSDPRTSRPRSLSGKPSSTTASRSARRRTRARRPARRCISISSRR